MQIQQLFNEKHLFLLMKIILTILIISGWLAVIWNSAWPIILTNELIEKINAEQQEQQRNYHAINHHTLNDDEEVQITSDQVKLVDVQHSLILMSLCSILFTMFISIVGLIGVIYERIICAFMYTIFVTMDLLFTITHKLVDPFLWMMEDDAGKGKPISFMVPLFVINILMWLFVRLLFKKQRRQHLRDIAEIQDQRPGLMEPGTEQPAAWVNANHFQNDSYIGQESESVIDLL